MLVEYEISEQDYLDAQRLAIRNSPIRLVRWTLWVLPVWALVLLAFLISVIAREGFSSRVIVGLAFCLYVIFLPLLSKRKQKQAYARNSSIHGKLFLEVTDEGVKFRGKTVSSQISWSQFPRFSEDKKSFVLYQRSTVFNIVPKRDLSPDQVEALHEYFEQHIGRGKVSANSRS